jgi:hypothetical protein
MKGQSLTTPLNPGIHTLPRVVPETAHLKVFVYLTTLYHLCALCSGELQDGYEWLNWEGILRANFDQFAKVKFRDSSCHYYVMQLQYLFDRS